MWSRWSATARHSSSTPSPAVATVHTIGGCQPSPSNGPDSSSIWSRSRRVDSTPPRSALLIANTSAISISPALLACTLSPHPGLTTTTVVSALPATSTSTWPTPTVSTQHQPVPEGVEQPNRLGRGERQPAEVAARGHRADEHPVVGGVVLHAHPVAEDRPARERRRWDRSPARRPGLLRRAGGR